MGVDPAVNQGQFDIVKRIRPRDKIERLKNEPDLFISNFGKLVIVHLADVNTVKFVKPCRRRIETAKYIHERRFAGTGRPHDRDVLTTLYLK